MQLAFADTGNQSIVLEVIKRPQEFSVNNLKSIVKCFSMIFTVGYVDQFNPTIDALVGAFSRQESSRIRITTMG